MMTREYTKCYAGVDSACVVSVVGLDAISTNRLRGELRSRNLRMRIIKNSLARRALANGPLGPLGRALAGPCALVTGGESIIDVARTLVGLRNTYPAIELKQGILDGDPEILEVEQLAKMKSWSEQLGEVAMLISSPARLVAGCLAGPGGRFAGCLRAITEKEDGGEA